MDDTNHLNVCIIKQLQKRREDLGLAQRDVDDIIDMACGPVAKWETGVRIPNAGSLLKWASALDCVIKVVPNDTSEQT